MSTKDPNTLVEIGTGATEFEAAAIAASLTAEGIEAHALWSLWSRVFGGFLVCGLSDRHPVMVRAAEAPRAAAALAELESAAIQIDWDQIEVGAVEESSGPPPIGLMNRRFARVVQLVLAFTVMAPVAPALFMAVLDFIFQLSR